MEPNQTQKIAELEAKIDAVYKSVETTRKYMKWTSIITVAVIVLPLIGLAFAIPSFMTNYVGQIQSLSSY
jgi:hypothetical protein